MSNVLEAEVYGMQFGLLSPTMIIRASVVHVNQKSTNSNPVENSLFDPRMGPSSRQMLCTTCSEDWSTCPGHFGHIVLDAPVFNVLYNKQIVSILKCVCAYCYSLLIKDTVGNDIKKVCKKVKECPYCANPAIDWKELADTVVVKKSSDTNEEKDYSATEIYNILSGISADTCRILDMNPEYSRPEWMMFKVFPVPPPCIRPSAPDQTGLGDLTQKLALILRETNTAKVNRSRNVPKHTLQNIHDAVQYHVTTYISNDGKKIKIATQRSNGNPTQSLSTRLRGKEGKYGRLRWNVMGKRVEHSARSVITPDPNLALDEIGLPKSAACELTYPERVNERNIETLMKLVIRGAEDYPGANMVIYPNGDCQYLAGMPRRNRIRLYPGCIVERHVRNGDWVIFNRQPSLHRMSMMAHRIHVLPYSTFRMNLSATTPYNADFDGDEMNLHVLRSPETIAEAQEFVAIQKNIVSSQSNRPVIGIVQDTLFACRQLTNPDTLLDRPLAFQIFMHMVDWDGIIPTPAIQRPRPLWTGAQMFSMAIPAEINLNMGGVVILRGELISGQITKKVVGSSSSGGLIHTVWLQCGSEETIRMISNIQRICDHWLLQEGHSVGIQDCIAPAKTVKAVQDIVNKSKREVRDLVHSAQQGTLKRQPGMSVAVSFEAHVNNALNKARDSAGIEAANSLKDTNKLGRMVAAGSKGSNINISQIMALVGQQNVSGGRIKNGFNGRTLPHFTKDDYGPESRGFVENSYVRGLTPQEFFFHAMAGREGIIDTACKTSESGYIHRKLAKHMEDIQIQYDGTVRNSHGRIVQFQYGDDNVDPTVIVRQEWSLHSIDEMELDRRYRHNYENILEYGDGWLADEHQNTIVGSLDADDAQNMLDEEWQSIYEVWEWVRSRDCPLSRDLPRVHLPVDVSALIVSAQQLFVGTAPLSPVHVVIEIKKLCEELESSELFKRFIITTLASRRCCEEYKLTRNGFDWLIGQVRNQYERAAVHPGTSVGMISAESVSEPATQMTLNTFHHTGISAKNVTLGLPRLKELLAITKHPKTPSFLVRLSEENAQSAKAAKKLHGQLEYTSLGSLVTACEVYFDGDICGKSVIPQDQEFLDNFYLLESDEVRKYLDTAASPWLLRLEFSQKKLLELEISMSHINDLIHNLFVGGIHSVYSDDNADVLVYRLRILDEHRKANDKLLLATNDQEYSQHEFLVVLYHKVLASIHVSGIVDIQRVYMKEESVGTRKEWIFETDNRQLNSNEEPKTGAKSTFLSVLGYSGVDATRTTTNDVLETNNVLGIEAARTTLLEELRNVLSFDGSYVNNHHLSLLVDVMTSKGFLMPITWFGMRKGILESVVACATLERPMEVFPEAAISARYDSMSGVSEHILAGSLANIGTGFNMDLIMDEEMLMKHTSAQTNKQIDNVYSEQMMGTPLMSPVGLQSPVGANIQWSPEPETFLPMDDDVYTHTVDATYTNSFKGPELMRDHIMEHQQGVISEYSPSSPVYSPLKRAYSPSSPAYSPSSPAYSPSSPAYSPSSPAYSPSSPAYSPSSPAYSPSSPAYSPSSPAYSPSSPAYSPSSPAYSPSSPAYSPSNAVHQPSRFGPYSPSSPVYDPNKNFE